MDAAFFSLTRNPFERDPGLDEACLPPPLAELVRDLVGSLQLPRTISIVVGKPGAGKTTIASVLAATLGRDAAVARVTAAHSDLNGVLQGILGQLEPQLARGEGFVPTLDALARTTAARWEQRVPTVIIVDNAHQLDSDAIGNLCRSSHAHVVLCGRPTLLDTIGRALPEAGRGSSIDAVQVRALAPLSRELALDYLADRVAACGGRVFALFAPAAQDRIIEASEGFVSRIEELATAALDEAQRTGQNTAGIEIVERVLAQAPFEGRGVPADTVPSAPSESAPVPAETAATPFAVGGVAAPASTAPSSVAPPAYTAPPPTAPPAFPPSPPPAAFAAGVAEGPGGAGPRPGVERRRSQQSDRRRTVSGSGVGKRPSATRRASRRPLWLGAVAAVLALGAAGWYAYVWWVGREVSWPGMGGKGTGLAATVADSAAAGRPAPGHAGPAPAGTTEPSNSGDAGHPGSDPSTWGFSKDATSVQPPSEAGTRPDTGTRVSAPRGGDWVIQVGAFRSRRNAEDVVRRFRSVDPGATIRMRGELHCVVTHSFASQADAVAFLPRVREMGFSAYARRWVEGS